MAQFGHKARHRVRINVRDATGNSKPLLHSSTTRLPQRLIKWLFGDFCEVVVLTPGKTVGELEIQEIPQKGSTVNE